MKNHFKILSGAVALALAGQVSAATTWDLTAATISSGAYGVTSGTVTATATGWANTGPAAPVNLNSGVLTQQIATGVDASTHMKLYGGGLGINNLDGCSGACAGDSGDLVGTAPQHAIDNQGRNEMVLLSFGKSVNLTNVKFGWTNTNDNNVSAVRTEYTVMAYTGGGAPVVDGKASWGALGAGWVTIGNYADASTGTAANNNIVRSNNTINSTSQYSSYWLIGAYNPLGGSDASGFSSGNDFLKLSSVSGNISTNQVPEPGSLALFGLALLGMLTLRQRQQA